MEIDAGTMLWFALVVSAIMSWGFADLSSRGDPSITTQIVFIYSLMIFFGGWIFGSTLWYILWLIFIESNPNF